MDGPARAPLAGLEVVECASFVAGPVGGMTLAQLGADVIRVDPVGGAADHGRWPVAGRTGASYYWASLNRGKRSIAVDLRSEEGRELVTALVTAPGEDRGILVDNAAGRRWLDHDTLAARRPDLVHVRVQGHADGRAAVDYTVNAEAGVPAMTGPADGAAPVNHVLPAWDLLTGLTVTTGLLAALRERTRTGRGAYVEVALADVALAGVADLGWLAEAAETGPRARHGNHLYGSFGTDFACADGRRVMVVALTAGQWAALGEATGTSAVFAALGRALDADLAAEAERYRLREAIAGVLRPWFAARDGAEVAAALDGTRVLWGRYRDLAEVVAAHRAGEHDVLADVPLADGDPLVTARSPLRWDGAYGQPGAAPALGRDTDEVLAGRLGLSEKELAELHARGVIAGP